MRRVIKTLLVLVLLVVAIAGGFRAASAFRETDYRFSDPAPGGSFVSTEMGEIYVRDMGAPDGIPVLLVHGSVGW